MENKMIISFLVALALTSAVDARRNPNVCGAVDPSNVSLFKNDFAACEAYFWCDGNNTRPTIPCRDGFAFDEANQVCDQALMAACLPCPAAGNIAVGVQADLTCRQFRFCTAGVLGNATESCGVGTRFNRDTGLCALESEVPCIGGGGGGGGGGGSTSCQDDLGNPITGDIKVPGSCNKFQFCNNGVVDADLGIMDCESLHFNPTTRLCDLPANLIPPCVETPGVRMDFHPTVKHITSVPTMKARLLRKLHLNF